MAKPDPALLDPARYPFTCRIEPRFGDLDVNLHINNVAMASIMEDAHARFHQESGYRDGISGLTSMVASLSIEYLGEGSYPEPVDCSVAIESMGRTSHTLLRLVRQGGSPIAFSRVIMVTVGPEGPAPNPNSFVEQAHMWTLRS